MRGWPRWPMSGDKSTQAADIKTALKMTRKLKG
jgi:putative component of toxin-antitoxin plasmid stabilization module